MSDANGLQTGQAGKTENQLEAAIATVRSLGLAQHQLQSRRLHPYRLEWLDQLEERYRRHPGKPTIHLSDLPGKTAIKVSNEGETILRDLWATIRSMHSTQQTKKLKLDGINNYAVAKKYTHITLETLKRATVEGWSIDELEPFVTNIKSHKNNWPKDVKPNKLPFDFLNEDGAAIMAYYTDSKHGTCTFTNKDLELHDFMKRAVEQVVGHIEARTSTYEDVSETYWSLFLRTLVTIAGIDTDPRQKVADNPAPLWLFTAPNNIIAAYLRALWSAEGNARAMRLTQSKAVSELAPFANNPITRHDEEHRTTFNELPEVAKEVVRARPSKLLTSSALLHNALGLDVGLRPFMAYIDSRGEPTIEWAIEITDDNEIRKFSEIISFDSKAKRQELAASLS